MPRPLVVILLYLLVTGCTQPRVEDHNGFIPAFDVEAFFSGTLTAHGVVRDRSGTVIRTFDADIQADSSDGVVTLDEDFVFDDGEEDKRVWKLVPREDGSWGATAGDVIGEGSLTKAGHALFLDYVLRIPYGDSTIDIRVDDRMYRVTDSIVVNESRMFKFGVQVGSILLVIVRQEAS